jgi:nitroreductase
MTLMYAAWNQGVASCPMEGFDADALAEEFGVPAGYEPVMLVTLGYPADDAADVEHDRKVRRPVEEIVHYGSFDPVDETDVTPGTTVAEQADD